MAEILTDSEIAEIATREQAATPEPWVGEDRPAYIELRLDKTLNDASLRISADACVSQYGLIPQGILWKPDAEFVAHARTDIPRLIDSHRALAAERDRAYLRGRKEASDENHAHWSGLVESFRERAVRAIRAVEHEALTTWNHGSVIQTLQHVASLVESLPLEPEQGEVEHG